MHIKLTIVWNSTVITEYCSTLIIITVICNIIVVWLILILFVIVVGCEVVFNAKKKANLEKHTHTFTSNSNNVHNVENSINDNDDNTNNNDINNINNHNEKKKKLYYFELDVWIPKYNIGFEYQVCIVFIL